MSRDVEAIATSYVEAAEGDADRALRMAISDALADLTEAERRTHRAERLVSRGYARGTVGIELYVTPLITPDAPASGEP